LRLLAPSARLVSRELAQRGRVAPAYTREGQPLGGIAATAATETRLYGALAGAALLDASTEPALRAKIDSALASSDPERLLDAMDGLWMLAGGPPHFWRIWNPPRDVPTTRNDGVVPPTDGYPWRYFPETGHTVHGELLQHFAAAGGVEVLGYPRTDEFAESGRSLQFFDRALLEYGPGGPVEMTEIVADEVFRARGWIA
ncbi:MAG TPA: hypothetical protein VFX49_18505, partial [Chloroflexota bacterium]|nr:hypothetical protein [Chloroflexota bacterium]